MPNRMYAFPMPVGCWGAGVCVSSRRGMLCVRWWESPAEIQAIHKENDWQWSPNLDALIGFISVENPFGNRPRGVWESWAVTHITQLLSFHDEAFGSEQKRTFRAGELTMLVLTVSAKSFFLVRCACLKHSLCSFSIMSLLWLLLGAMSFFPKL